MNECRICLEEDEICNLISPCLCRGTTKYIHEKCLNEWRILSENRDIENETLRVPLLSGLGSANLVVRSSDPTNPELSIPLNAEPNTPPIVQILSPQNDARRERDRADQPLLWIKKTQDELRDDGEPQRSECDERPLDPRHFLHSPPLGDRLGDGSPRPPLLCSYAPMDPL